MYVFFFFKQKTAYEMRISDWSSDVCSSDLLLPVHPHRHRRHRHRRYPPKWRAPTWRGCGRPCATRDRPSYPLGIAGTGSLPAGQSGYTLAKVLIEIQHRGKGLTGEATNAAQTSKQHDRQSRKGKGDQKGEYA